MEPIPLMRWATLDETQWHPVPYAWFPACFECVTYWLEQPPYERRMKFTTETAGPFYEYRKRVDSDVPCEKTPKVATATFAFGAEPTPPRYVNGGDSPHTRETTVIEVRTMRNHGPKSLIGAQKLHVLGATAPGRGADLNVNKCVSCEGSGREPHSCPYQADIADNDDPEYCNCCIACTIECADDI